MTSAVSISRADAFRNLLEGYVATRPASAPGETRNVASTRARFESLLGGFADALRHDAEASGHAVDSYRRTLSEFAEKVQEWRTDQIAVADDFDMLGVFGLANKETRHSRVLAWLLCNDPKRSGTHAQGNLGFRLFLEEVGLPSSYADTPYHVSREEQGDESRVDLEIRSQGRFVVHIEAKIWASEGLQQTQREWADLQRRAAELSVPRLSDQVVAFYLTPSGVLAADLNFRPLRWATIANLFEKFAAHARPPAVQVFATHYARALRRRTSTQSIAKEQQ